MAYGQPYWWEGAKPLPKLSSLPSSADILIIGAGYTGLTAAITAATAGAEVTVVDAEYPGFGASSRNGGMCGPHPRLSLSAMSKQFDEKTARALFNESGIAFDYFQGLIRSLKIDCDYQKTGRIQLAWTKKDFEAQKAMAAEMLAHTDYAVEVLERDAVDKHIKTDRYFGALFYENHGALNPKKLIDGLLSVALKMGVKIVPNMPIRRLQKSVIGHIAEGPLGTIRANKVLLATNGYTKGQGHFQWLSARVFPLPSYIIATEKLPRKLLAELAPGKRTMVETRARHSYFRLSPDGTRIVWGGRAAIRQINPEQAIARLTDTLEEIWPSLKGVKITHAWKGNTGYSFGNAPNIGRRDGVHYAAGYCGGGVVLAPYLGMKAAYQMLGDERGTTAYADTKLQSKPYHIGGRPWFLEPADRWYNWVVDGVQNVRAAKDRAS